MLDNYTKVAIGLIAVGLWVQIAISLNVVNIAKADDDDYVIQRILYCIDGSRISGSSFSTYCNR